MATRVLVIDDEQNIAKTLVWLLQDSGMEAAAAYDGPEALTIIETFPPDIVISDVIMPGMSGIELCEVIQKKHPQCKILLFSGQAATIDLVHSARSRGLDWELLVKPIDPDELVSKLDSIKHSRARQKSGFA
jgi:DNA-binding response OmpR family regulator